MEYDAETDENHGIDQPGDGESPVGHRYDPGIVNALGCRTRRQSSDTMLAGRALVGSSARNRSRSSAKARGRIAVSGGLFQAMQGDCVELERQLRPAPPRWYRIGGENVPQSVEVAHSAKGWSAGHELIENATQPVHVCRRADRREFTFGLLGRM